MGQWIVARNYGRELTVPANENATYVLTTTPDYGDVDPSALEDEIADAFVVQRVVGQVFARTNQTPSFTWRWGWRLMGLQVDLATGLAEVPWVATDDIMNNEDIANEPRWWGERYYDATLAAGELHGLTVIDNPWWTHVDLHPRAYCGTGSAGHTYPCLVIDNTEQIEDLTFAHRLRMWVEPRGR